MAESTVSELEYRKRIRIGKERVEQVAGSNFPGHYPGETNGWNLEAFKLTLIVTINSLNSNEIEFDLVGVDASVANALRRIVISEVATIAIETVYIWNNTSIVQDEVLAQRLGLIPLAIDPLKLESKLTKDEAPTDLNTVVFNLVSSCERRKDVKKGETLSTNIWKGGDGEDDPESWYIYTNKFFVTSVKSGDITFDPKGSQGVLFKGKLPQAANKDILIAKMRGGQEIVAELHCNKGIGQDHAKWSPVSTASYRLLPTITILEVIPTDLHHKFQACFSPGVIDISSGQIVVANPRADTVSREVLRHSEFADKVELGRVRDHFIYTIESAGQYKPEVLLPETFKVLLNKIKGLRTCLAQYVGE